jgi:isopenicillin N synthase-like dioxygenase
MINVLSRIPLVDLADDEPHTIDAVACACREWGFFQVANHGIDAALIRAALHASKAFFALSIEAKQALSRTLDNPWGYYDREFTKNLRDRKEIFDFSPTSEAPWPSGVPDFRETLESYSLACHGLALRLLKSLCLGLGVPADYLESNFRQDHTSFTRLNHYPVHDILARCDAPAAGPLGISQHTDAGALTVLQQQDDVAGLQVASQDQWFDIYPVPGTLTINIGDMVQVWSNDCYTAPLHRVRRSSEKERYSIAYFLNPTYASAVSPLPPVVSVSRPARYKPINWGEFRSRRAEGDYGDYGEEVQISHYRM